jgi:hypothetical protein
MRARKPAAFFFSNSLQSLQVPPPNVRSSGQNPKSKSVLDCSPLRTLLRVKRLNIDLEIRTYKFKTGEIMKTKFQKLMSATMSLTFLVTASCGQNKNANNSSPNLMERMSLASAPEPANRGSEKAQLSRYRGQTEFLNPVNSYQNCFGPFGCPKAEAAPAPAADAGSQARAEQESDIYKIGKPGSKLLYLLNNYRGLQVISYADGAEKPKIVGRVQATGNYPDEMYYDAAQDRLLVIERYAESTDENDDTRRSRLVAYDVSEPTRPKIQETKQLKGILADSRIVGDVLYVATSADSKGAVTSYSLKGKSISEVATYTLSMPVSYQKNMNIVSSERDGVYSYHLIATLSESGWGWWDRSSVVEVIDISNPKGRIEPVMSVAAKGFLRERSQTTIKNNTLIVTSNYLVDEKNRIARIAVETFRFPTAQTEVLTEKEAQFRKLNIDRELEGQSGETREQSLEKLVSDPKLGIKGRFVRQDGQLRKMMPDSSVTVGDGSGLSANLQDVRYQDGFLYAFWVPANQMDPMDLFDISDPESGVKYLSRLQFDGWIQRAIPMTFAGRTFVLGLGRVVSVVNNETGRQRPQAMIFEIVNQGGKFRAFDVAQYTFEGSDIWTNYNDQDKMVEVHTNENGTGEILFEATRYGDQVYSDGGQILNFDLKAIIDQQNGSALKPGAFLAGGADWIRRVFTNSEINRINSFSDQALATFSEGRTSTAGTLKPAHILELARNMRAYETVTVGDQNFGVQLISDYSWMTSDASTTVRVVPSDKADTEKPAVLSEILLPGNYLGHVRDQKTGDLIVLSNSYQNVKQGEGYSYRSTVYASRLKVDASGVAQKIGETSWSFDRGQDLMPLGLRIERGFESYYGSSPAIVQLQDGTLLAQSDSEVKVLDLSSGIAAQNLTLDQCRTENREAIEVQVMNSKPYLSMKDAFESAEYKGLRMTRNWLAPLTLAGNKAACGSETNIPGRAVLVTAAGEILSSDTYAQDIIEETQTRPTGEDTQVEEKYFKFITKDALISTKIADQKATLVDEAPAQDSSGQVFQVGENEFARMTSEEYSKTAKLEFLKLDGQAGITTDVYAFQTDLKQASLIQVVPHPAKNGVWMGVLESNNHMQVVQWTALDRHPVVKTIVPVNERMEKLKAVRSMSLSGSSYSYYGGGGNQLHFTAHQMSFERPQGLAGVSQFFIQD